MKTDVKVKSVLPAAKYLQSASDSDSEFGVKGRIEDDEFSPNEKRGSVTETEIEVQSSEDDQKRVRIKQKHGSWLQSLYFWPYTTEELMEEAEQNILSYLKTPYQTRNVNIGKVVGDIDANIWTLSLNEDSDKIPLVLLHGMGAGLALWVLNLDELAANRPVYAIDLLGFGRSSRPAFSSDPQEAETEIATAVEAWRQAMGLDRFVLLGHSLGGYISTAYTLRYPDAVAHLVLADPWGFKQIPEDLDNFRRGRIPYIARLLVRLFEPLNLNPLVFFRLFGPKLVQRFRPDLIRKYDKLDEASIKISHYMYHCNAQNPTGETLFHTLMEKFGWAKNPMGQRISQLDNKIPITFVYGSNSWVDHYPADEVKELRGLGSYCDVHVLEGAGHHVYADSKETFNQLVLSVCSLMDK